MNNREARFTRAVDAFLKRHALASVADVVTGGRLSEFLAEPAIGAYLTRPASDIRFDEHGEPMLDSEYERQFYAACRAKPENYIPFRAQKSGLVKFIDEQLTYDVTPAFYASGMHGETKATLDRVLHKETQEPAGHSASQAANVFLVANAQDPYQIGGLLRRIQGEHAHFDELKGVMLDASGKQITLPDKGFSFLVFTIDKDKRHAITLFAVIDNAAKKVLHTGLCNSWANQEYTEEVACRLNMDVNPERRPDIQPFSMLDCSHRLQTASTDLNCGLYRFRFARALITMLQQDESVRQVLTDPNESAATVEHAVIAGMKAHLPEYYTPTQDGFEQVSEEQKRQVALETRWETGNAHIREKIAEFKQIGKAQGL